MLTTQKTERRPHNCLPKYVDETYSTLVLVCEDTGCAESVQGASFEMAGDTPLSCTPYLGFGGSWLLPVYVTAHRQPLPPQYVFNREPSKTSWGNKRHSDKNSEKFNTILRRKERRLRGTAYVLFVPLAVYTGVVSDGLNSSFLDRFLPWIFQL